MRIIDDEQIKTLRISPEQCVEWVREAFLIKDRCLLPPKISLHPKGTDFINTMPCIIPPEYHTFGCKIVSRIKGQSPSLNSELLLFDTRTGRMTTLMDANWITAMRTGAVAALAINTFRNSKAHIYSFVGLGAIGKATLECFLATNKNASIVIRLMKYKDHAEKTISEFCRYANVEWVISETMQDLVMDSDVVVSCITEAKDLLIEDTTLFKAGTLLVPVHTRGFQNCDLVFDKVFADDKGHVEGFKYFNEFNDFAEFADVLKGENPGRENDNERILSYNIGIGIQDVYFAYNILQMVDNESITPPPQYGLLDHLS